jgi:hypothetical protein
LNASSIGSGKVRARKIIYLGVILISLFSSSWIFLVLPAICRVDHDSPLPLANTSTPPLADSSTGSAPPLTASSTGSAPPLTDSSTGSAPPPSGISSGDEDHDKNTASARAQAPDISSEPKAEIEDAASQRFVRCNSAKWPVFSAIIGVGFAFVNWHISHKFCRSPKRIAVEWHDAATWPFMALKHCFCPPKPKLVTPIRGLSMSKLQTPNSESRNERKLNN